MVGLALPYSLLSRPYLHLRSAAIEASIFLSQAVWLARTRSIRKRAKEAELIWDEFPEAQAWEEKRWRFHWRKRNSLSSAGDMGPMGVATESGNGSVGEQPNEESRTCDFKQYRDV